MKTLILLGFLFSTILFTVRAQPLIYASPGEIHVPDNYPTIQGAINAANPEDVIYVHANTYIENVVVNKKVYLIGDGVRNTFIDGDGSGPVVTITSSNVMISGFNLRNSPSFGVHVILCDSSIITNNHIVDCATGISIDGSYSNMITDNSVADCTTGFSLTNAFNSHFEDNIVYGNLIRGFDVYWGTFNSIKNNLVENASAYGMSIGGNNHTIWGNTIAGCATGMYLTDYLQCENNTIFHNNFFDNQNQIQISIFNPLSTNNRFDLGWPKGGNYWSDHNNPDIRSGPNQLGPGSDAISDVPYNVDSQIQDRFPCAGPINYFEAFMIDLVEILVISNSTVTDFRLNMGSSTISFNVTGDSGVGFCRVDIPNPVISGLWQNSYRVLVDGVPIDFGNWTEGLKTYIYFRYLHSTRGIVIEHWSPPTEPAIESCDLVGDQKDLFALGETVYVTGINYLPTTTYDLYIVVDVETWTNGMPIPERVPDTEPTVSSDMLGDVVPTVVWHNPQIVGKYDIVVDVNSNSLYDEGIDALDDNDVEVTAGFIIPEFTLFLILILFMLTTLLTIVSRRKLNCARTVRVCSGWLA